MDYLAKNSSGISKEKHAIIFSTVGNIGFLAAFYFIGPIPGMWTKSTATVVGVSEMKNTLGVHITCLFTQKTCIEIVDVECIIPKFCSDFRECWH